jgi:hypothetical protein
MKMALIALALLASIGVAAPALAVDDRALETLPHGDALDPDVVEGQVVALDPPSGQLLLATAAGVLALQGEPEDVADLEVGDVVMVRIEGISDERPMGRTPTRI